MSLVVGPTLAAELTKPRCCLARLATTIISVDQRELRCRLCRGRFVDPLKDTDRTANWRRRPEVTADDSEVTETTLYFTGNVQAQQGYRSIRMRCD